MKRIGQIKPLLLRNIVVQKLSREKVSFYFFDENSNIFLVHNRETEIRDILSCFEKVAILFYDGSYLGIDGSSFKRVQDDTVDINIMRVINTGFNLYTLKSLLSENLSSVPLRYIILTRDTRENIRDVVLGRGYLYTIVRGASNNLTFNLHTNGSWPSRFCENVNLLIREVRDVISKGYTFDHVSLCDTNQN
nr:putative 22 kDa protein [Fig virus B]